MDNETLKLLATSAVVSAIVLDHPEVDWSSQSQPIPEITENDVIRIIQRDFPTKQWNWGRVICQMNLKAKKMQGIFGNVFGIPIRKMSSVSGYFK